MRRIVVDPPHGPGGAEAHRDRVERKLFEQLAAVRVVERAESVIPPAPPRRTRFVVAGAGLAAAAALALVVMRGGDSTPEVAAPSRIVTPVGDSSQVTLREGVIIDAKSDTSVEIQHGPRGAITLVLQRGSVECDVEPRPNRPPFRVKAGDVVVEVVGTRFTVTRTPAPRVDVARGTVRVTAPGGEWLVEAGEAWPVITTASGAPAVDSEPEAPEATAAATSEPEIAMDPVRVAPVRKQDKSPAQVQPAVPSAPAADKASVAQERERARESYKIAIRVEDSDPRKAAQLYRAIATDGKGMEAVALLSLAEVQLRLRDPRATLAALDELARRFPNAANTEDAAWFRYEALRAMGKRDEARGAAADYLRQFPNGAYAGRLRVR